jgi:HEAT repeat protein
MTLLYQPLPRKLEAALRDIVDPKANVRVSAARDLPPHAEEDRERVIAALEKALSDRNALVRATAAECLGDLAATEALPALLVAVEDDHQLVRQKAIAALGEARDPRAQKRLERALRDERPEVRFQAVMAYPRVASSRDAAVAALAAATRDEDDIVVHVAFRMAEELAEADSSEAAPPSSRDFGRAAAPILERARACLGHASPRVRAVAAVVLASAGDAAADEVLVGVIDGSIAGCEAEDVAAAIDLAPERALAAAIPALRKRAFSGLLGFARDMFWWHARTSLARLGDDRAKRAILADFGSLSFERRTLAVSAAARARLPDALDRIRALRGKPDRADPTAVVAALEILEAEGERPDRS